LKREELLILKRFESSRMLLKAAVAAGGLLLLSLPAFSQIPGITAGGAQKTEASVTAEPSDSAVTAIRLEDLPAATLRAADLISNMESRLSADSTLLAIADLVPSAAGRVDSLCSKTENIVASQPTIRSLRNLESEWQALIEEVDAWRATLAGRISAIGEELNELSRLRQAWRLTEERAAQDRLPGRVVAGITQVVSNLEETQATLFDHRGRLLLVSYRIADIETKCRNRIDLAAGEAERIRARLTVADAAPLWDPTAISEADDRLGDKVKTTLSDYMRSIKAYVQIESTRMLLHLAFLIVSAIGIAFLGRYAAAHSEGDETLKHAAEILRNPIPSAFLVAVVVDGLLHAHPPAAWVLLLNLLLLIPIATLVPRLMDIRLRIAVYILAGVYLANGMLEILPQHSFVGRALKLAIKLTLLITALWLMRRTYRTGVQPPGARRKLTTMALGVILVLIAVSAVAGIVGNVFLSNVLFEGVLDTLYLGLLVWLAAVVLRNVITVVLKTDAVKRTNIVRKNGEDLRRGILTAVNIGGVLVWLMVSLDGFKVLGPAYGAVKHALIATHKIGSIQIAMWDIVLFFFIVWLSFFISRILRAILRDEVYPRVRLAHGVPMAISKLAHYAILLIGFFFAIGAAGIDLNKFTLLAGALGVGIGFGLQNIVSNLVSGIIVLFERPVQTGDKVKIGTNEGEIKSIGLRATVVRTWEGAEVMIPNSRLVLDEVTNWTLSDQNRRIDVQVGVAYGSDTDKVTELLLKVAKEHNDVLEYPEPTVLFTSFGDSSLNFSLRAWTARFRDFLRVGSELTSGVNKALAEAGITIPFPQRDVHMRSEDQGPSKEPPATGQTPGVSTAGTE
jgi:small-conductance mechanosensitive channel